MTIRDPFAFDTRSTHLRPSAQAARHRPHPPLLTTGITLPVPYKI